VLDLFLERGFPVNYAPWGTPFLHVAIGNRMVELVEYLVAHGADLDAGPRGRSAREHAEQHYDIEQSPDTLGILQLCGGRDPETVLRTYGEERARSRKPDPRFVETLEAARKEASNRGQDAVSADNLFIALLRDRPVLALRVLRDGGVDLDRLRRSIEARLAVIGSGTASDLHADAVATAALHAAEARAEQKRHEYVTNLHLLFGLLVPDDGTIADWIGSAGGSLEKTRAACAAMI
jgi:hypothetical protein